MRFAVCGATLWLAWIQVSSAQPASHPVHDKLQQVLGAVHTNARVVLRRAALSLDPWMDADDVRNQQALAEAVDASFDGSPLFNDSGARLSRVYFEVLEHAQWARSALTVDQRKQLAAAGQVLYTDTVHTIPTAGYRTYLNLKKRADELQKKWDETPAETRSADLATDLQDAKDDLAIADDDGKYSTAAAVYASLINQPSPSVRRTRLRRLYDAAQSTAPDGTTFVLSTLGAGYTRTVQGDSWTRIEIGDTSSSAVTLPRTWGRPAADGSVAFADSRATGFSLSFNLAAVPIVRPWFDSTVFADRIWRWKDASHPPISVAAAPSGSAQGLVPYFATHALVAADIAIQSNLPADEWAAVQRAALRGETLSWGPFLVSGRHFDPGQRRFSARRAGSRLVICDVQIIGWLLERVPDSPRPDMRLDWGQDGNNPAKPE